MTHTYKHNPLAAVLRAGRFIWRKYRTMADEVGTQHAARNMRKAGFPIEIALAVLAVR